MRLLRKKDVDEQRKKDEAKKLARIAAIDKELADKTAELNKFKSEFEEKKELILADFQAFQDKILKAKGA